MDSNKFLCSSCENTEHQKMATYTANASLNECESKFISWLYSIHNGEDVPVDEALGYYFGLYLDNLLDTSSARFSDFTSKCKDFM